MGCSIQYEQNQNLEPLDCRDKLRRVFPQSAWQVNGYGQTEVSVMAAGPQEYEGLGEIPPGVTLKVTRGGPRGQKKCPKLNSQKVAYHDS